MPAVCWIVALVLCLTVCGLPVGADTIVINSTSAQDSNSTLQYYLCEAVDQLESNTTLELSPGIHSLEQGDACRLENITDLTIRGANPLDIGEPTVIFCVSNVLGRGFVFLNVTNLEIENIWIENCGRELPEDLPEYVNSTFTYFGPGQRVVLLFSHCMNVYVTNVTVDRSFGFGIVGINLMGISEMDGIVVSNTDNTKHIPCGVGLPTDLTCSGSGAVFVYEDDSFTARLGENVTLTITNSIFINNTNSLHFSRFLPLFIELRSAFRSNPLLLTGSSGLAVTLVQLGFYADININHSRFENNIGDIGSLLVLFYNTIRNTQVHIDNCKLLYNSARLASRGGGLLVGLALFHDRLNSFPMYPDDIFEVISITRSAFIGNQADSGGAIYFHISPQNVTDYRIRVAETKFISNVANVGSGVQAASIRSTYVPKSTHLLFENVEAYDHIFPAASSSGSSFQDSAVFVFTLVHNVTFTGTVEGGGSKFYNNSPGVILASGGNVLLRGYVKFENNFAFNGGALSLYDNALLYFYEGSTLEFIGNRALQSGGAIYINALGIGNSDACAIQFLGPSKITQASETDLLNLTVTFIYNTAREAGNSIYANPLYRCAYLPEASIQHTMILDNEQEIYQAIFNYPFTTDNGLQEITSIPHRVCFCNQTQYLLQFCYVLYQTSQITTLPGKTFTIQIVPIDIVMTPVASLLYAQVDSEIDAGIELGPNQNIRTMSGVDCSSVNFNLYGKENTEASIYLFANPGGIAITLQVTIGSCPPGFELDFEDGLKQCVCDNFITNNVGTTCNTTSYTIARPDHSWIGLHYPESDNDEVAYVSTCPINYCNEGITEVDIRIIDQLCEKGHSGLLCGECKDDLSVVFGSAKCKSCSHLWLLLDIPLFTLLGLGLVLLLFILDLTVTRGTINGLIFYVNVVSVNANIFFRGSSQGFHFIFISLLNLELGFPLCFYDGMNEAAKVGMQFIFPVYLLLMCGAIIFLSRRSKMVQKLTAFSGVQVLATLVYLSYSKILRTVIDILSFATLRSESGKFILWLYDGNVHYMRGVHILLTIVAIVVILGFIIPYTLSLALIVQVQRFARPRMKPLVDAYIAPYKDRRRYWFGARLILLVIMCVVYAVLGTDDPGLALLIQLLFIVCFSLMQALVQPFRNYAIELLDLSFLVNFIILTLTTSHIIDKDDRDRNQKTIVNLMLSFAFIVFLGIVSYHILLVLRKKPSLREKMDRLYGRVRNRFREGHHATKMQWKMDPIHNSVSEPTLTAMTLDRKEQTGVLMTRFSPRTTEVSMQDSTDSSAPDTEFRPPTVTFSKLREPVLSF